MQSLSKILNDFVIAWWDHRRLLDIALSTHAPAAANVLLIFPHLSVSLFLLLGNYRWFVKETNIDLHSFFARIDAHSFLFGGGWVAPDAGFVGAALLKIQLFSRALITAHCVDNCGIIFGPGTENI